MKLSLSGHSGLGIPTQAQTSTQKKPSTSILITKASSTSSQKDNLSEDDSEDQLSDFKCPGNGNFPNLKNGCKSYFQCEHVGMEAAEMGFEHQCPPGLLFNKKKEFCDWPANVKCA